MKIYQILFAGVVMNSLQVLAVQNLPYWPAVIVVCAWQTAGTLFFRQFLKNER